MEKALELLRGWAEVSVAGAQPELFLNICAMRGIELTDCRSVSPTELRCTVARRRLAAAGRCAERAQCELKVRRRRGASYVLGRVRRRYFLLGGLLCVLLLLGASSMYIWDIDVVGNESVSTSEILNALEQCGVGIGSNWTGFNADMIRSQALELVPELSFLTVNVHGSRATVIVRERIPAPDLDTDGGSGDVTARRSGIIESVNAFRGEPMVSPVSPVLAGDTLISGSVPGVEIWGKPTQYRQVGAMGEVKARTFYEFTAMAPLTEYEKQPTGREATNYALVLGEKRLNFYQSSGIYRDSCDTIYDEWKLGLDGVFTLPVSLVRETRAQYELVPVERTADEIAARLRERLAERLNSELDGGEVLSTDYSEREGGGCVYVTLRATCLEDIALNP